MLFPLTLGACNSPTLFKAAGYSNPPQAARIDRAFEARDACLTRNAAPTTGEYDIAGAAQAVALSCMPETNQLIVVSNPAQDPRVTAAIMADNEARALRFVRLARSEGAN